MKKRRAKTMVNTGLFEGKTKKETKKFFIFSFLIASFGLLLSFYATIHHLKIKFSQSTSGFSCNVNDIISCDKVALSSYSEFLGVPLGVIGIGFFLVLIALLFSAYRPSSREKKASLFLYIVLTILASLVCLALAFISFAFVGALCLVCLGVYFSIFSLLGLIFWFNQGLKVGSFSRHDLFLGSSFSFVIFASVIVIFSFLKPSSLLSPLKKLSNEQASLGKIQKKMKFEIPLATTPYMGKGEDYRIGSDDAKVVIHEFVDFECPSCRVASSALKNLITEYPDKLLVVFRNYPLDNSCNPSVKRVFHKNACLVAKLARCAGRKGNFWKFHDLAFSEQEKISEKRARTWASTVGLSEMEINNCLQDKFVLDKIQDDISQGEQLGVKGTPSIYVNGLKFEGNTDKLRALLEQNI